MYLTKDDIENIYCGNLKKMKGCFVNYVSKDSGLTPLMIAAICNHVDVVKFLLRFDSCDINARDKFGKTALMGAAIYANIEVIEILKKREDLDITIKDKDGNTAADLARKRFYCYVAREIEGKTNNKGKA